MKTHRFHTTNNLEKDSITLTDPELVRQMTRVLKFHQGENVTLINGEGLIVFCKIEKLTKEFVELSVVSREQKNKDQDKIINLYFAIPKKNNFELILEKGTEIGVNNFFPLTTDRTQKLNINKERAFKIIKEATEQSERSFLPKLNEVQKIENALKETEAKNSFVFHTEGQTFSVTQIKTQANNLNEINIFIGPEGGWSEKEIEQFKSLNFETFKIGEAILKTETAAIVIPSLFLF